jgi:hypothetical protein
MEKQKERNAQELLHNQSPNTGPSQINWFMTSDIYNDVTEITQIALGVKMFVAKLGN